MCDYDLRGQSEPRCPECGYRFEWAELLDPARRRHEYLFEHHPRRSVWSFLRTVCGAMRPRRFWASVFPTQPLSVRRLVTYWVLLVSLALAGAVASGAVRAAAAWKLMRDRRNWSMPYYASRPELIPPGFPSPQAYVDMHYPAPSVGRVTRIVWTDRRWMSRTAAPMLLTLAYPWIVYAALHAFRWSMRCARVHSGHVLRCVVYSSGPLALLATCLTFASPVAYAYRLAAGRFLPREVVGTAELGLTALGGVCLAVFVYRLAVAYRDYLRFPRPTETVLAAQVVAALVVLKVWLATLVR